MTTFQTSRELAASPAEVFSAIEDPARLARWWGPDGFRNSFDVFEFKPGGRWQFTMHGPDGSDYPNESVFAEIEAARKVVIDHVNAPRFRLTIDLQPSAAGTLVPWVQVFEDAAVAEAVRHIVEPSNEQNLNRLMAELTVLRGACHCGAVQWSFKGMPDGATACNCTVCRRYGALWAYDYEDEGIKVTGPTQTYVRGKAIEFHFCPGCGCVSHWLARSVGEDGRRRIAVNLRLAEPDAVAKIPIDHFEGLVSFEDLPRDGRCVADYWF